MPYATKQDMIDLFGDREVMILSNLDNEEQDITEINDRRLNAALAYASDKINIHVLAQYPWVREAPPDTIRWLCADIARYHLEHNEPPRADVVKRAEEALETLEKIAEGKLALYKEPDKGSSPTDTESGADNGAIAYFALPRVFPLNVLEGY